MKFPLSSAVVVPITLPSLSLTSTVDPAGALPVTAVFPSAFFVT
nr:hypothetical protein [Ligilactobacillus hayakitensis]